MSSSSKYSGLAGTILLGTLLGLNYTQYARRKSPLADKAASFNPEDELQVGSLFDKDGKPVPLGKTNLPGSSFVNNLRDVVPDVSPLVLCAVLSGLWAIRTFGAMNKVLNRRYSDVVYQIRRPDIIANRLTAWKYLGLGCLVVPATFAGSLYLMRENWSDLVPNDKAMKDTVAGFADSSIRLGSLSSLKIQRSQLASSVAEFNKTLREGFKP